MPELPEVETIRRALLPQISGLIIRNIDVYETRLRRPLDSNLLIKLLQGQKIGDISRRAKYLIFQFENENVMIIHLGMSGRLQLVNPKDEIEKHTHVIFSLSDGRQLRFKDTRRFGFIEALTKAQLENYEPFLHLGVEPLTDDFSVGYLLEKAGKSERAIKSVLMDANIVVGVGNIYANEALFHAGIHPLVQGRQLNFQDCHKIVDAVKEVLQQALLQGGTTINDFRDSNGEPGSFQVTLHVYSRKGEPCLVCGTPIERIAQIGRSSFFCPICQTMPCFSLA